MIACWLCVSENAHMSEKDFYTKFHIGIVQQAGVSYSGGYPTREQPIADTYPIIQGVFPQPLLLRFLTLFQSTI